VRTRVFVKDINQWEAIARAHGQRFADIQPVNTMVQANLIGDEYLVEIEAEAMVE
jgi:enamine deaminase RidA (YjgF/YER057c/UK114 family)